MPRRLSMEAKSFGGTERAAPHHVSDILRGSVPRQRQTTLEDEYTPSSLREPIRGGGPACAGTDNQKIVKRRGFVDRL